MLTLASPRAEATSQEIAMAVGANETKIEYLMNKMEDSGRIHGARFYNGKPTIWRLAQAGREYLVVNDLLK